MVALPPVDFPRLTNRIEVMFPETIVSLVNALLLATRRIMSNEAITCSPPYETKIPQDRRAPGTRKNSTNLSLAKDRGKYIGNITLGTPRSDKYQSTNGIKGRRLNKHGDDGIIQSARSGSSSNGNLKVLPVQEESYDDHEREEDVDCKGDRKVWIIEVEGNVVPVAAPWFRSLEVNEHDTHCWIRDVSGKHHD